MSLLALILNRYYPTKKVAIAASATPVAEFSLDVAEAPLNHTTAGTTVNFTDLSTNTPTSWSWEKNDGSGWVAFAVTSTQQNPTQQFTAGTWSIRLTASNAGGAGTPMTKVNRLIIDGGEG